MTPALPPVLPQPAAPQSRDTAGALAVDTQRPLRAAREAETARAPRPVDAPQTAADPRLTTRRDRPVGPPPAFAINLLQHLRETALDPPEFAPPGSAQPDSAQPESAQSEPEPAEPARISETPPRRDEAARYPLAEAAVRQVDLKL